MVIKGRARGGAAALAAHLERRDTNERVSVSEMRGVTARDVRGALLEMDAMGIGAESVRTLYHASINTAPGERLTAEQKRQAADRLEKELGFAGQPRIIVEHLKKDREHMHVVFLRIDTGRMIAIPDSHNYRRHELVARELEREFGHDRVRGAHIERDGQARPERTPSHADMQQAERTGLTPQEAKARVTALWKEADSGRAFAAAVEAEGWVLARGDKRDFVIVDSAGGTHSLPRRIEGARAADVRQRMSDVDQAALPGVDEARSRQKERSTVQLPAPEVSLQPVPLLCVAAPDLAALAAEPLVSKPRPAPVPQFVPAAPVLVRPEPMDEDRLHDEAEKRPASALFRQLYTAAAEVTQKVVGRARWLLERRSRQEVAPSVVTVPEPVSEFPASPAPVVEPPKPQSYRRRSSAAELAAMLERQRARSQERDGPER